MMKKMKQVKQKLPYKLLWSSFLIVLASLLILSQTSQTSENQENLQISVPPSQDVGEGLGQDHPCQLADKPEFQNKLASANPCLYIGCSSFF